MTWRDGGSVETADTGTPSKATEKSIYLLQRLVEGYDEGKEHTCPVWRGEGLSKRGVELASIIALDALNRIVRGKEGDGTSWFEAVVENENEEPRELQDDHQIPDKQLKNNPLLLTNAELRESRILPLLARAFSETLCAVTELVRHNEIGGSFHYSCLSHMKHRLRALASLIDGTCCLTSENRQELYSDHKFPLIGNLLLLFKILPHPWEEQTSSASHKMLHDMVLSSLRTLTSLTYENAVACGQLMHSYQTKTGQNETANSFLGVRVLVDLLHCSVRWRSKIAKANQNNGMTSDHHYAYDSIIFCLNSLTNASDTRGLRKALAGFSVRESPDRQECCFLEWLTCWLLETASFRDAVMQGSFGNGSRENDRVEMRHLEPHEEDRLVLAGNGFILLSCLMKLPDKAYAKGLPKNSLHTLSTHFHTLSQSRESGTTAM